MIELRRGDVCWAELNPTRGREQAGRRPVLVVSSNFYLQMADTLAMVVPVTTVDRNWPNHIELTGDHLRLSEPSFAMTEQVRTITRERLVSPAGYVDSTTMQQVDFWLKDFLGLG